MGGDLGYNYNLDYKNFIKAYLLKSTLTGTLFHSVNYITCPHNLLKFCQPTGLHLLQGRMKVPTCNNQILDTCFAGGKEERERGKEGRRTDRWNLSFICFQLFLSDLCPVSGWWCCIGYRSWQLRCPHYRTECFEYILFL